MSVSSDIAPLDEVFLIESVGGRLMEQWYYVTEDVWYPDRKMSSVPLQLRPSLQLTNPDTRQRYVVDMSAATTTVRWYYREGSGAETLVTNTVESLSADYTVKANGDLVVRKNVAYSSPVTLRCQVAYAEPRTGGAESTGKSVVLRTNQDAKTMYSVHLTAMDGASFSPLAGDGHLKRFMAAAFLGDVDVTDEVYMFHWFLDDGTGEQAADGMPGFEGYSDEAGESRRRYLTLDMDYIQSAQLTLRVRARSTDADLKPCSDGAALAWRVPKLISGTYSPEGNTVRQDASGMMTFRQSIRTSGGEIPEDILRKYVAVEWTMRDGSGRETAVGTGPEVRIPAQALRNEPAAPSVVTEDLQVVHATGGETRMVTVAVSGETRAVVHTVTTEDSGMKASSVRADVYLRNECCLVTQGGAQVTQGGKDVITMA